MTDLRASPTPIAMLIGTAIIAAVSGYMIGVASSLGFIPIPFMPRPAAVRGVSNYDDEEESEEEDIDASILDHAPNWENGFEADKRDGLRATAATIKKENKDVKIKKEENDTPIKNQEKTVKVKQENTVEDTGESCKMVLVVRTDLGMTKGKIGAQCGHATLACYKHFLKHDPKSTILRRWEREGQMKVALQVKGEDELDVLQAQAISLGLVAEVIADAGRTQIAPGSHTVLGIGPGPASLIDQVTGTLRLL